MSGRSERREHQLLELMAADEDTLTLLVESVDREVAYEELRTAVEELAVQERTVAELSTELAGRWAWVERLTAGLPLPVVVTDADGAVVEANARVSALLSVPVHRLLGKPLVTFVTPADRVRLAGSWQRLGSDGRRHDVSCRLRSRRGEEHAALLVGLPEQRGPTHRTRWFVFTSDSTVARHEHALALAEAVTEIAALPQAYPTHQTRAVLRSAVSFVAPVVPGATASSLTLGEPSAPGLQVSDSAFSQRVDALEVYFSEGPCVDAYRSGEPVTAVDVPHDPRWPVLSRRAREVGLAGVVAAPVVVRERTVGVLNVYAQPGGRFDEESSRVAAVLAGALGALLAVLHERTELEETSYQLREALQSRPVIDQAKGIVMASHGCSADEAFQRLVRHSRRHNIKVRDLAATLAADPGGARELR